MTGTVTKVTTEETGVSKAGKPWRKQVYVIETDGQYPKMLAFEVWNDNIKKYDLGVGDEIKVEYEATSREHNGKFYHNIRATGVTIIERSHIPQAKPQAKPVAPQTDEDSDDLPF
jgi:hypothetical protein